MQSPRLHSLAGPAEADLMQAMLPRARLTPRQWQQARARASELLGQARHSLRERWVERFMHEYSLQSEEGLALLALAEAYLRVPDADTAARLVRDKLAQGDWRSHLGASESPPVNAATIGLMLGSSLLGDRESGAARGLLQRLGGPAVRQGVSLAMRVLGGQFVFGRDISEALRHARRARLRSYRFSFDMLGEAAHTAEDARRYLLAYADAIRQIGAAARSSGHLLARDGVSVKLSALHSRYEPSQREHAVPALTRLVIELAQLARECEVALTIDAEESDRLVMSLEIMAAVAAEPSLSGWDGLGLAVQAYQRRAPSVIEYVQELAARTRRRLLVRLVKGAYWDSEIKRAQERGLADYPVFTRKAATDVSYLTCARAMLSSDHLYPAFATHNALTVATVLEWVGPRQEFEFQRLHGMGEALYERLMTERNIACRIYAPVGGYAELLPYLVRRLLENGANASFVHRLADLRVSEETLLADPVAEIEASQGAPNAAIPAPPALYGSRTNSAGVDLANRPLVAELMQAIRALWAGQWQAAPIVEGEERGPGWQTSAARAPALLIRDPADGSRVLGTVIEGGSEDVEAAFTSLAAGRRAWAARPVEERAQCLVRLAELLEADRDSLLALAMGEAGKTLADAVAEVREAVDYCRYYAATALEQFRPQVLPGPTGEHNELQLRGRGIFVCISPWNFPLAIFLGQVCAALVAGNAVLCKSAPQTPLIAAFAVRLLLRAGVPGDAVAFLPGGAALGAQVVADPRLAGVAFTGSTSTAWLIAATLQKAGRPIVPLIAETGGLNAMIVDSTALPEQVVSDVISSAFMSAGQRCSALRLLCLQEDVAESMLRMLKGALDGVRVGDPARIDTDVGPVIDARACNELTRYVNERAMQLEYRCQLPVRLPAGFYVAPAIIRLEQVEDLHREVFGPILHVVTWRSGELPSLVERINALGYGLTMGVHSRLRDTIDAVRAGATVGNLYVNRSMVGAVVGSQPFGGEGLSGTGPKAGGPRYLQRFALERTVSINTTAAGGNVALLSLENLA